MNPFSSEQGQELNAALDRWFARRHGIDLNAASERLDQLHDDYEQFRGLTDKLQRALTQHTFNCERCGRPVLRLVKLTESAFVISETGSSLPPATGDGDRAAEFVEAARWFNRHRHRPDLPTVVPLEWFAGLDGPFPFPLTCDCLTRHLGAAFVSERLLGDGKTTMLPVDS